MDAGIERPFTADEMRAALAALPSNSDDSLKSALRTLRQRVMLRTIARDLGGLASLAEVMATATTLAEITLARALARLLVLDQFTRWQSMNWDYAGKLQKAQMDVVEIDADLDFRLE